MIRAPSRLAWAVLLGVLGCGAPPRPVSSTSGGETSGVATVETSPGHVSVALVPRPSEGMTWLSLWIDAGSRDAPPGVAAVAAWALGAEPLEGRALPDAIELRCRASGDLGPCVSAFARALATRSIPSESWEAASQRLRAARRGAASDTRRTAELLAVRALLGDATGLDPLEGEGAPGRGDVEAFLADHLGPERALLVAIGETDERAYRDLVARELDSLPRAARQRSERGHARPRSGLSEPGSLRRVSVALDVPSPDHATAIAELALREGSADAGHMFELRGAGTLLVLSGDDPSSLVESVAYADALELAGGTASPEGPHEIAERIGLRWTAGAAAEEDLGLAVGLVDALDGDALASALASAVSVAAPFAAGSIETGASVHVRAAPFENVVVALASHHGAHGIDPHARALVAGLFARCVGERADRWLEPSSFGVAVETTAQRWRSALADLAHCARTEPDGAAIELARAEAIGALSAADLRRAWAARALAPGAEGLIAPRGSPEGLARATHAGVLDAWRRSFARDAVTFATVGPVEEPRAQRAAHASALRLPERRTRAEHARVAIAAEPVIAVGSGSEESEIIIALRDPATGSRRGLPGARSMELAWREALSGPEHVVRWSASGADRDGSWLAIALRSPPETIEAIPARIEARRSRARDRARALLPELMAEARESEALAATEARASAIALVTAERADEAESDQVLLALAAAPARLVIVRSTRSVR